MSRKDAAVKAALKELRAAQAEYNYVRSLYMTPYRRLIATSDRLREAHRKADKALGGSS